MGKKGSWLTAIKKAFTHSSKDKVTDGTDKTSSKEKKKKGIGKKIPLFREPSSIEKILGEAEKERHITIPRPLTPPEPSKPPFHVTSIVRNAPSSPRDTSPPRYATHSTPTPPRVASPRVASPSQAATQRYTTQSTQTPSRVVPPSPRRAASPSRAATPVNEVTPARPLSPRAVQQWRVEPTLKNRHVCATKIQTAFRGYMARRSYRAVRGLVRLQGVVNGQSVKRQTADTLKCMQILVRLQTQIQARRIQMQANHGQQRQALNGNDKDEESAFDKWLSENQEDWEDSTLTKEEIEARMQRKFDAIVKRERAMSYAYSHQPWKSTPRIGHGAVADFRTGGYPYWWNWLEQRQPPTTSSKNLPKSPAMQNFNLTPTRSTTDFKASPLPQSNHIGQPGLRLDNLDTSTPKSTRSSIPTRTIQAKTLPGRFPQRFSRGSATTSPFNGGSFRDNDSLTSCPPFSVPRYMAPTVSAQAKLKDDKKTFPGSPGSITSNVSSRRNSFPLGQGTGSFKWNKGSIFSKKETSSKKGLGKNQRTQSVGNLSIDSSTSMPASLGKRAFNRFV